MFDRKSAILLALTSELVAVELVLIFAGSWLDNNRGWGGKGVLVGAVGGMVAWIIHLIFVLKDINDEESD